MTLMPIHVHRKAGMLLRGFLMRRSSRPDPAIQV